MTLSTTILACFLTMTPSYETSTQTRAFQPTPPMRESRTIALSGELGWNGVSGSGLLLSWSPVPNITFDGGFGLSLSGPKVGLQGRYNLLKSNATPYIGVGVGQAFGSYGAIEMDGYSIEIDPKQTAHASVGLSYVHENGFTMLAGLGYTLALQDNAYKVIGGSPSREQRDTLNTMLGDGPTASIALGYSFKS